MFSFQRGGVSPSLVINNSQLIAHNTESFQENIYLCTHRKIGRYFLIRLDKVRNAYAKVRLHHRCGARVEVLWG